MPSKLVLFRLCTCLFIRFISLGFLHGLSILYWELSILKNYFNWLWIILNPVFCPFCITSSFSFGHKHLGRSHCFGTRAEKSDNLCSVILNGELFVNLFYKSRSSLKSEPIWKIPREINDRIYKILNIKIFFPLLQS